MDFDDLRAESATRPLLGMETGEDDQPLVNPASSLDSAAMVSMHGKLMGGFLYERRRQTGNRIQMALDHEYYDSIQLTDEDIAELTDRGQPLYVYNLVKRTADWVIGTEKRSRFDFTVQARNKEEQQVTAARAKTDTLKYLSDVNKTPFRRSQAFRECVISGLGWLEDGVRGDPDEEPLYSRNESWRNILHDSHALELDGSDMKYLYRYKYVDLDVAQGMFPKRAGTIAIDKVGAIQAEDEQMQEYYLGNRITGQDYLVGQFTRYNYGFSGFVDNSRDRVKLIECWYRKPVVDKVMSARQYPQFHGQRYNPMNDDHMHAVVMGDASVIDRLVMAVYYAIMTESSMLDCGRSPYRHNRFPFTPMWCYRRGRDNQPYGLIRPIRDPQDGFNARMRKALFALSAYKVTGTSNAIDPKTQDWEDIRLEAGRPDAMLIRKAGTELDVTQDRGLAEGHMKLAEMDASLILDSSGVTADNLGMESNAQSGKAIIAKQSEGASVTAEIFDNLRYASQLQGEIQLSLAEQYITEERVIRITDSKGRPSWKTVNEIVQNPDGSVRVLNDITATKSDFVIDEQDFNVSMRQAASEKLMDLAGKLGGLNPMITLQIIEMAIDNSNLPDKDDVVKRLRTITGYSPAEDALTPDEQQQQQQAQEQQEQQQQAQQQQQKQAADAEIKVKLAQAEKMQAEAQRFLADADRAKAEAQQLAAGDGQDKIQAAIAQAQDEANAKVQACENTITELKCQLAARRHEVTTSADTEKYKADKVHAATVEAARLEHVEGKKIMAPEHQEGMADLMQTVKELQRTVEQLVKAEKSEPKAAPAPQAPVAPINLTVNGQGVKVDDGKEARDAAAKEAAAARVDAAKESAAARAEEAKRHDAEMKALAQQGENMVKLTEAIKAVVEKKPGAKKVTLPNGEEIIVEPAGELPGKSTKKPKKPPEKP